MPDLGTQKDTTVNSDDYPGQVSVNFFGEGGQDSSDGETVQDAPQYSEWYAFSRSHDNGDLGGDDETEYLVHRIGGDDVFVHGSRNVALCRRFRDDLGADLEAGEVCFYTGAPWTTSTTYRYYCYILWQPDGTLTLKSYRNLPADGAPRIQTITLDPTNHYVNIDTTGDIRLDPDGEVKIGGAAATDYGTLFTQLKSQLDNWVTIFNTHYHVETGVNTQTATASGFTQVELTTAARATKNRQI